ncbi:hypothetical protein L1887_57864 [Cichorium endivia]|nr:hypothetical protein L1887_57864 [Cichorium endivia]
MGNCTSWRPARLIRRTGLANDTCLWGPRPLLLVGKQASGTRVASSPDSDLEAFSHNPAHGSLGHAFTVRIRTGNQNQTSFYPSVPHEISVLVELILGHLRYLLTDVPPQPNSPPDNVFRPDRPAEAGLGSKKRGIAPASDSRNNRIPLVRTSSELAVRRPGRPPKEPFPVRPRPARGDPLSPREAARAVRRQPTGSGLGPPCPALRAHPFPRPDAVMSTTGRGRHSVLRIFKGRRGRTGHRATCGALPAAGPYLRLSRFQGGQAG